MGNRTQDRRRISSSHAQAHLRPQTDLVDIRFDAGGVNAHIVLTPPEHPHDSTWFSLDSYRFTGAYDQNGDLIFRRQR